MESSKSRLAVFGYFGLGVLLSISITIIRYVTGPQFQIGQFYIIPIIIVTWYVNRDAAALLATLSIFFWVIFDFLTLKTITTSFAPGLNEIFRLITFILIILLIDNYKHKILTLTELSVTDPLTKLFNRRAFLKQVELELERSKRYDHELSLIYIDIDNFKEINDKFGHNIGDKLLVEISEIFMNHTRNTDMIGRMGGDEFCILLPETPLESSQLVFDKLNSSVEDLVKKRRWFISLSAGITDLYDDKLDSDGFVTAADELMYKAKHGGKNRCEVRQI